MNGYDKMELPTLAFGVKKAKTISKEGGQSDLCSVYKSRTSKHQTGNSSVTL